MGIRHKLRWEPDLFVCSGDSHRVLRCALLQKMKQNMLDENAAQGRKEGQKFIPRGSYLLESYRLRRYRHVGAVAGAVAVSKHATISSTAHAKRRDHALRYLKSTKSRKPKSKGGDEEDTRKRGGRQARDPPAERLYTQHTTNLPESTPSTSCGRLVHKVVSYSRSRKRHFVASFARWLSPPCV